MDPSQEDLRALAQVRASMLLERDRIGAEGWLHSSKTNEVDKGNESTALLEENEVTPSFLISFMNYCFSSRPVFFAHCGREDSQERKWTLGCYHC
jgi:hypothetical protein